MLWYALAWSATACDMADRQRDPWRRRHARGLAFQPDLLGYAYLFKDAVLRVRAAEDDGEPWGKVGDVAIDRDRNHESHPTLPEHHVVVLKEVGNATVSHGKSVAREFSNIAGQPLPLPVVPDVIAARGRLVREFPYATAVIDQILEGGRGRTAAAAAADHTGGSAGLWEIPLGQTARGGTRRSP